MIDTLVFDMGNILIEWNKEKIIQSLESDEERRQRIEEVVFTSGLWEQMDAGILSVKEAEQKALLCLGESYALVLHDLFWHWFEYVLVFEEVQEFAIRLVKTNGYRVYILSNTSEHFYKIIESGKLPLYNVSNGVIVSFEEQLMKPDVAIYQRLIDKYAICPERTLFIDDIRENVVAAQSLGFHGLVGHGAFALQEKIARYLSNTS